MLDFIKLIRLKHWIKNFFLFLPAFFGGVFSLPNSKELLIGWLAFSFIASTVYIINDLNDLEEDKKHQIKKNRPLVSGKVSRPTAVVGAVILLLLSLLLSLYFLPINFTWLTLIYLVVNILYSFGLKNVGILELLMVSSGFLIRVIAGSEIVGVMLSFWLLLMTFLFAFFIVIAKRRDDFTSMKSTPYLLRKVNKYYSLPFLNICLSIVATLLMVCYIMYTIASKYFINQPYLALLSCVLVIVGLTRYFQAVYVENKGGDPTSFILKDTFLQVIVVLWAALFYFLIYS